MMFSSCGMRWRWGRWGRMPGEGRRGGRPGRRPGPGQGRALTILDSLGWGEGLQVISAFSLAPQALRAWAGGTREAVARNLGFAVPSGEGFAVDRKWLRHPRKQMVSKG